MYEDYVPVCLVCDAHGIKKVLTWTFYLCDDCMEEYGRTAEERPEWLNELIRWENNLRNRMVDGNRIKSGKEEYIADNENCFSYEIDFDTIVEYRIWYSEYKDSNGELILNDSDWEAFYTYGW